MSKSITNGIVVSIASVLLFEVGDARWAQAQQTDPKTPPVVEGDWVRTDTNGSSSFGRGGPNGNGSPDGAQPDVAGQPYVTNGQTCRFGGAPQLGLEYDSEGFHLVMNRKDAVFMQKRGAVRHVYLDGCGLPTAATRPPSGSGCSVGHFEGDTLVIDTTDMTAGGVTAGGYRTPEMHVIQRYIPSADGQHLVLKMTWIDPKIYKEPHEYEYTFDRMEPGSYALETFCDATDPLWGQSIVPPTQQ